VYLLGMFLTPLRRGDSERHATVCFVDFARNFEPQAIGPVGSDLVGRKVTNTQFTIGATASQQRIKKGVASFHRMATRVLSLLPPPSQSTQGRANRIAVQNPCRAISVVGRVVVDLCVLPLHALSSGRGRIRGTVRTPRRASPTRRRSPAS